MLLMKREKKKINLFLSSGFSQLRTNTAAKTRGTGNTYLRKTKTTLRLSFDEQN